MKKMISITLIILLFVGFGCTAKEKTAITIDNITITRKEFEDAFETSRFALMGKEGRKAFLDSYITSKLILKEAEKMGLDKDPQFLSEIQFFWERALLKLVLSKKTKELALDVNISDQEIRKYYKQHQKDLFAENNLPQVYDQIKWLLVQGKQSKAMKDWGDSLRTKTNITIDYQQLGIKE